MPASRGDLAPDRRAAGEAHHVDPVVHDELVAERAAGADDDLEDVLGQPGLAQQLGEAQRRDRRGGGGLEDDDVAGGDRRRHLVGDQVEREVERRDGDDHAARLAEGPAEAVLAAGIGVHLDDLAGGALGLLARPAEGRGAAPHLDARVLERLAALGGDDARDLLAVLLDEVRGALEDLGALPRRCPTVGLEGDAGAVEHGVGLIERGGRHGRDLGAVPRAAHGHASRRCRWGRGPRGPGRPGRRHGPRNSGASSGSPLLSGGRGARPRREAGRAR